MARPMQIFSLTHDKRHCQRASTLWRRSFHGSTSSHGESFSRFSQTFPIAGFPLRFSVSETSYTSVDHTSLATLTLCVYMLWLSDRSPRERVLWHCSMYSVRSACHFACFTWLRLLSTHILYSTHSTLCLFTSLSLCWCFTLVVNSLLTAIAHHVFSSVLAEPHEHLLHLCYCYVVKFASRHR